MQPWILKEFFQYPPINFLFSIVLVCSRCRSELWIATLKERTKNFIKFLLISSLVINSNAVHKNTEKAAKITNEKIHLKKLLMFSPFRPICLLSLRINERFLFFPQPLLTLALTIPL